MNTRRNNNVLWLAVTAAVLMGFSFAAGYGLRALMWAVHRGGISALAGGLSDGSGPAFAAFPRVASRGGAGSVVSHGQVMGEVIQRLKELYVEQLPASDTLSVGSVEGMLDSLGDTNTRLLAAKEWSAISSEQSGAFHGLGAVLTIRRHQQAEEGGLPTMPTTQITVVAPMPGSPAEKIGLQPGDRITTVDNHWIAPAHYLKRTLNTYFEDTDYSLDPKMKHFREKKPDEEPQEGLTAEKLKKDREAAEHVRDQWRGSLDMEGAMALLTDGADGEHTITYERAGLKDPVTVKVIFAKTSVAPVVKKKLAPGVGYIQVRQINTEAVRALDQALAEFRTSGLKSLVLDLRRSPGGTLDQAQEIASRFLKEGAVAILERRDSARAVVKKPLEVKPVAQRAQFAQIAVLVDGGTAGSAEVLAAALHDAGIAKLVGATTFGSGTEQTVYPLDDGAAISITTAKMLSRKGIDFDGKGLKPDVPAASSEGADRALEQALHVVHAS